MGQGLAVTVPLRLVVATLALALVAACGTEKPGSNSVAATLGSMAKASVAKVKPKKAGGTAAAAPAPITRAELEKYGVPILRVTSTTLGQDGFLTMLDAKGEVQTWATPDGVTFSLRNGILIQTRGLGPDLMSADVPTVGQLATSGSTYQRLYFYLGADDAPTRRTFDCVTTTVGRETIQIVGRSHDVTHVTETCARTGGKRTNEYWIEGKTIRKSHQYISAPLGYLDFERVVD